MKPGVIAIVLDEKKSSCLWLKRRDVPIWVLPGGGIHLNEPPEEAVLRELQEEVHCRAKLVRQVALYTPVSALGVTTYTYLCELITGPPQAGEEAAEVGFFPICTPPKGAFHIHRDFLRDALENGPETVHKLLEQVTVCRFLCYFFRHPIRVMRFALSKWGYPLNSSLTKKN